MSTFTLSNEHISAMLSIMYPRYPGDTIYYYYHGEPHYVNGNIHAVGQLLLDENYRSVNYRYSENNPAPRFFYRTLRAYTPVEIIKACDSYRYQSCETDDWEQTEAFAICEAIRERAIDSLPGYDEADTWSINC